ncbi:DUF4209 domain-containing protein [Lentisphaerota bacterium WC36G]|nr:DUF4209 domain-containing protein [Lentisphaerae bacterium WC36]
MSQLQYNRKLKLSVSDFQKEDFVVELENEKRVYYLFSKQFQNKAVKNHEQGNLHYSKLYFLLNVSCYNHFDVADKTNPFKPQFRDRDLRTLIPDDFEIHDLEFLAQCLDYIDDVYLKARIADIVWSTLKKGYYKCALTAIEAYSEFPMCKEKWQRHHDYWERATILALQLGDGAKTQKEILKAKLKSFFKQLCDKGISSEHLNVSIRVFDLIRKLEYVENDYLIFINKLEKIVKQLEEEQDFYDAIRCLNKIISYYDYLEDKVSKIATIVALAECHVKDAESRISGKNKDFMSSASIYEKAIQTYRRIPATYREQYNVNQRLQEINLVMTEAGNRSHEQMGTFKSDPIDFTNYVEDVRKIISGLNALEAILTFINIVNISNYEKSFDDAKKQIKDYPLINMIGSTHSKNGRVVAKTDGINLSEELIDNNDKIKEVMIRNHKIHIFFAINGYIFPALETLHLEQNYREEFFLELAKNSSIVPPGRAMMFAKGLYAGYNYDYITALHILCPQIENMVRYHLNEADIITTTIDEIGIENEKGLSSLIKEPAVEKIFGKNLKFEFEALLCSSFGPNFRNEIAHGLAELGNCNSNPAIYFWWLCLKLLFCNFWNEARAVKIYSPQ